MIIFASAWAPVLLLFFHKYLIVIYSPYTVCNFTYLTNTSQVHQRPKDVMIEALHDGYFRSNPVETA